MTAGVLKGLEGNEKKKKKKKNEKHNQPARHQLITLLSNLNKRGEEVKILSE